MPRFLCCYQRNDDPQQYAYCDQATACEACLRFGKQVETDKRKTVENEKHNGNKGGDVSPLRF